MHPTHFPRPWSPSLYRAASKNSFEWPASLTQLNGHGKVSFLFLLIDILSLHMLFLTQYISLLLLCNLWEEIEAEHEVELVSSFFFLSWYLLALVFMKMCVYSFPTFFLCWFCFLLLIPCLSISYSFLAFLAFVASANKPLLYLHLFLFMTTPEEFYLIPVLSWNTKSFLLGVLYSTPSQFLSLFLQFLSFLSISYFFASFSLGNQREKTCEGMNCSVEGENSFDG